jgi:hypothetical protein
MTWQIFIVDKWQLYSCQNKKKSENDQSLKKAVYGTGILSKNVEFLPLKTQSPTASLRFKHNRYET